MLRGRGKQLFSPTASLPLSKDRGWIASPRLRFTTGHTLRIVPRYCHICAIAVVSSRLAPELRHRITQARFAEHKLAANVFGQKHVSGRHSHQRGYRVQACLLYAAGTWDVMFDEATGPWQAAYISPLRRATDGHWTREDLGRPASVDQVMARAARPALPAAITAARLRFAALLLQGPMVVIALLQPRGVSAWSAHLCDDMRSMRNALQVQLAELPDPGFVVGPWCSIVREHRRPWKALVAQCQRFWYCSAHALLPTWAFVSSVLDRIWPLKCSTTHAWTVASLVLLSLPLPRTLGVPTVPSPKSASLSWTPLVR